METLPLEILRQILGFFDSDSYQGRRGLATLRCTCKFLASLVTPTLFAVFPVWLSLQSLQDLTNVADHRDIAIHIRTIRCSTLQFNRECDCEEMNEEVQDEISSESFNINDADIKFTNYLISYEKYNKERYYLSKNGMGERLLARALRRLPNLASVDVVFSSPWIGARMILGQMHGVSGLEYDFSSSEPINTLFHSIIQASIRLKSLRFMNADDVLLVGGVNDHDYRTLGKETRPYKSLAVPNGDEASGSTFSESRKLIAYLTNESSALRGLETFEILRISSEETPQRPQTFWESVSVCLINNAPTLRILQIGGELVGWETYAISKAMSDTTFPVLVTLSMTEMFFSKAELLIDIINATPNVQEVKLKDISIPRQPGWKHVANCIREMKMSLLKSFKVVHGLPIEVTEMASFLRGETDSNPLEAYPYHRSSRSRLTAFDQ